MFNESFQLNKIYIFYLFASISSVAFLVLYYLTLFSFYQVKRGDSRGIRIYRCDRL